MVDNPEAMHQHVSAFVLENESGGPRLLNSKNKKVSMNPSDAIFCGAYTSGDGLMIPQGSGEFDQSGLINNIG